MSADLQTPPMELPEVPARSLTWRGVSTMARLELRQRVRSSRWVLVLVIWTVVVAALTTLIRLAAGATVSSGGMTDVEQAADRQEVGALMFGVVVLLVLGLGALVAPALSATSVNGDRANGVLATLQTTLLTPLEIATGKLLAAWVTALGLLVTALPFILWGYFTGGTSVARLVVVVAVLALTLLVVCAVGLAWSAVSARTTSSAVLTYLTVMFLLVGLPLLFAVLLPLVSTQDRVTVRQDMGSTSMDANGAYTPDCQTQVQTMEQLHTERTWWLLAPSPAIVLADAAPAPDPDDMGLYGSGFDPLTGIRQAVRQARLGPSQDVDWCYVDEATQLRQDREQVRAENALGATWPAGLAVDLVIAALAFTVTVRRLRTPSKRLPRGTRVA